MHSIDLYGGTGKEIQISSKALREVVWKSIRLNMADYSLIYNQAINPNTNYDTDYNRTLYERVYKTNLPSLENYLKPREKPFLLGSNSENCLDKVLELPYQSDLVNPIRLTPESEKYIEKFASDYKLIAYAQSYNPPDFPRPPPTLHSDSKGSFFSILDYLSKTTDREIPGVLVRKTSYHSFLIWTKHFPLSALPSTNDSIPTPEPSLLKGLTQRTVNQWMSEIEWSMEYSKIINLILESYNSKGIIKWEVL